MSQLHYQHSRTYRLSFDLASLGVSICFHFSEWCNLNTNIIFKTLVMPLPKLQLDRRTLTNNSYISPSSCPKKSWNISICKGSIRSIKSNSVLLNYLNQTIKSIIQTLLELSTASLESLFQWATTLWLKNLSLIFNLNFDQCSSILFPCVLSLLPKEEISSSPSTGPWEEALDCGGVTPYPSPSWTSQVTSATACESCTWNMLSVPNLLPSHWGILNLHVYKIHGIQCHSPILSLCQHHFHNMYILYST